MNQQAAVPLISVVVPTYNYGRYLSRALDSVLAQQEPGVELIVVNDGSKDNTRDVLDEYQRRNPKLVVLHQENAGAAVARNNGIAHARAPFVLMLDADDALISGSLAVLKQAMRNQPQAGILIGGRTAIYPDGRERTWTPRPLVISSPVEKVRNYLLTKRIEIGNGRTLIRRDLLLERPFPSDLRKGEDIPVFAYALAMSPYAFIEESLVRVYKHSDSLRNTRTDEERHAELLVDAVFEKLPSNCQALKDAYKAQTLLMIFRDALKSGNHALARKYYRKAWRLDWKQAIRWPFVRKALRAFATPGSGE